MEVNNISKKLKEIYLNKNTDEALGVDFIVSDEIERVIKIFKLGYWSLMPFAYETYDSYAIKLSPMVGINSSPIVSVKNNNSKIFSPKLDCFLFFLQLKYMNSNDSLEGIIKESWADFKDLSKSFLEFTENSSLDFIEQYIYGKEIKKILEDSEEGFSKVYMDFWNYYNDSPSQNEYNKLVNNLLNDYRYLPESLDVDYGIWNSRVNSILAQRAYGMLKADFKYKEKYYWKYISQPHGFDAEGAEFAIIPSSSSDTYLSMSSIVNKFDTNPDLETQFSEEILRHPLFDAIQDLRLKQPNYLGEKHVIAAKILETEYNDPYTAWNALVTASYWAGRNNSKAIEPMWEAAIYLSEKHNWTEIHEVLVQQYEYYNHYKDKV
ncbi:hypothetical protein ABW636_22305 [Aquimarina sp. 2201CG1-2-11]|uniref:hypothetical protein n=1 Tax=Aquimarina discodermiae TaxID=3231043 RepID=UPI0034632633